MFISYNSLEINAIILHYQKIILARDDCLACHIDNTIFVPGLTLLTDLEQAVTMSDHIIPARNNHISSHINASVLAINVHNGKPINKILGIIIYKRNNPVIILVYEAPLTIEFHCCKTITKNSRIIIHKRYNLLAIPAQKTPLAILFQKQHTIISHTATIIYARNNLLTPFIDISYFSTQLHSGQSVIESRASKIIFTTWQYFVALFINRSPSLSFPITDIYTRKTVVECKSPII